MSASDAVSMSAIRVRTAVFAAGVMPIRTSWPACATAAACDSFPVADTPARYGLWPPAIALTAS